MYKVRNDCAKFLQLTKIFCEAFCLPADLTSGNKDCYRGYRVLRRVSDPLMTKGYAHFCRLVRMPRMGKEQ
jgi:hypothetical protein